MEVRGQGVLSEVLCDKEHDGLLVQAGEAELEDLLSVYAPVAPGRACGSGWQRFPLEWPVQARIDSVSV